MLGAGARNIQWTHVLYFFIASIVLPIYLTIFICLLILRRGVQLFQTTFYVILIQQAIADILTIILYTIHKILVYTIPEVLFRNQDLGIPAVTHSYLLWFTVIRSFGICFLTFHRYLTIVKPRSYLAQRIQSCKPWAIWLIYWVPPVSFSLIFFTEPNIRFDSPETLIFVMEQEDRDDYSGVSMIYLFTFCVFCTVSYGLIMKHVRKSSNSLTKYHMPTDFPIIPFFSVVHRELRLAFQVLLLLAAQLVLFGYMTLQNNFANSNDSEVRELIKGLSPLVNGCLSFISPITILLFNKDLLRRVKKMIRGRKNDDRSEVSVVGTSASMKWKTGNNKIQTVSRLNTACSQRSSTGSTPVQTSIRNL